MFRAALLISVGFGTSAWAQTGDPGRESRAQAPQPSTEQILEQAPAPVRTQVLRHASVDPLQKLSAERWNGVTIYQATFEGDRVDTRLRMDEFGQPVTLHIAGRGEQIEEAAGARRDDPTPAQPEVSAQQNGTVPPAVRQRMQAQLGEVAIEEVQPQVFYQLTIRHNGQVQQIWADQEGTILQPQQQAGQGQQQQ
ncbi:MAG: hypothetical protein ACK4UN_11555 [Limisphaerales bacterium]